MLQIGLENSINYTVTEEMSPPHLPVKVLSTPDMINLIERTCLLCIQHCLEGNRTTVGIHVCVSHTGPANLGEEITINTMLKEINKRRLLFEVEVLSPRGPISVGTHERAIVNLSRMGKKKAGS